MLRGAACLQVAKKAVPKSRTSKRKGFVAVFRTYFCNLRSVDVLPSPYEANWRILLNKLPVTAGWREKRASLMV